MFALNEKVVYPGHGVAIINRIIEKRIAGKKTDFFELQFLNKDMTILVPVENAVAVGIRALSSQKYINDILKMLSEPGKTHTCDPSVTNWNKRNKEYQGKLRTGDLREICSIYRDLKQIETQKELSFGEKSLLHQTESLLVEEIALVSNLGEEKAVERLRSMVNNHHKQKRNSGAMQNV